MNRTASILRTHGSEIMELWEKEVKKQVPAAKKTNDVSLYDHLPNILEDIADVMQRYDKWDDINKSKKYQEILENSKHHGRHRATTAYYTVEQVVHEYIVFHRVLTEFLKEKEGYKEEVSDLLKYVIETSILKSVGSFSHSIQEMQEKLIGTLAHDIRNPLSAAQLSLELIGQDDDKEWNEKMLVAAQRSVRKAINLVEGLMDGITIRAGEGMLLTFEDNNIIHDINWVFNEAKEVYVSEIIFESKKTSILGVFDGTAIRRLLENLISNAIKYGLPKHPVTISVREEKEEVYISVHNYGTPVSAEKKEHIFDFLSREDKDSSSIIKSWGMGLTLAQIVAEAHGGDIQLNSTEREGTTFTVKLLKHFNVPGKKRTKLTFIEKNN